MLFMGRWLGEDKRQSTHDYIYQQVHVSYCDHEGEKENKTKEEQNQTKQTDNTTRSHNPKP